MLRKWSTQLVVVSLLLVFLYAVPAALCSALPGQSVYLCGVTLSDILGCLVIGFLTNNYRFGVLLYLGVTGIELLLLLASHSALIALWIGDLIPALVAIYYFRQLYLNMGD